MSAPAVCRLCHAGPPDSLEHLFQSAIGGTLKVPGVLCTPCNGHMGRTVDAKLAAALEHFRMLLAIEGDRGQTASVRGVDATGRRVVLRPGALPESGLAPPEVTWTDENTLNVTLNSEEQARQFVESAQRDRPDMVLNVKETKVLKVFPAPINLNFALNFADFARAAVKTVLVLVAHKGFDSGDTLANAWRYVKGDPPDGCGVDVSWSAAPAPWVDEALGPVPHCVSVRSDPAQGLIAADVRYFGHLAFSVHIHAPVTQAFAIAHGVDPLEGTRVDRDDWAGSVVPPGPCESRAVMEACAQIAAAGDARAGRALSKRVVTDAMRKVIGNRTTGTLTQEEHDAIIACCNEEILFLLGHQDGEENAPDLLRVLQGAADGVRSRKG